MAALTLQQLLDIVMRKNREYEETILFLSTHIRRHPVRTQHGFICPDCSCEVAHACPPHFSITPSDNQPPLAMKEPQSGEPKKKIPKELKGKKSRGKKKAAATHNNAKKEKVSAAMAAKKAKKGDNVAMRNERKKNKKKGGQKKKKARSGKGKQLH